MSAWMVSVLTPLNLGGWLGDVARSKLSLKSVVLYSANVPRTGRSTRNAT